MHLSSLERYEIQAEAFRRMTGHLAPGKDAAAQDRRSLTNLVEVLLVNHCKTLSLYPLPDSAKETRK